MTTLHLCCDHNFISGSRHIFERYYPGDNLFIVHSRTGNLNIIKQSDGFTVMNCYDKDNQKKIVEMCRKEGITRVVLHSMVEYMLPVVKALKKTTEVTVYWIFWGFELYETIAFEKGYRVSDNRTSIFDKETYYLPNSLSKIIRKLTHSYRPARFKKLFPLVDYFCFWNKADYDLWKKYYDVRAKFRFFAYCASLAGEEPKGFINSTDERPVTTVMINHQASLFGNHDTIFKRLREIDPDNKLRKIVPLSYGMHAVRNKVLRMGKELFGDKFEPILDYMDFESYCKMLSSVDVAFFGQHRQEASGNIVELLKNGVKVFLRNDNNLLPYYRQKGYIVYSFDDDLKDMDSLKGLTSEQKQHNRQCYVDKRLFYDDFMPGLYDDEKNRKS